VRKYRIWQQEQDIVISLLTKQVEPRNNLLFQHVNDR